METDPQEISVLKPVQPYVYVQKIKPILDAVQEKNNESMDKALLLAGKIFNKWFLWAVDNDKSASVGLQGIASALRTEWFDDRATEGPDWEHIVKSPKVISCYGKRWLSKEQILFA